MPCFRSTSLWVVGGLTLAWGVLAVEVRADDTRQALLARFIQRIARLEDPGPTLHDSHDRLDFPQGFRPWWDRPATGRLRPPDEPVAVDLQGLILDSLEHSSRIRAIGAARLVARAGVADAAAAFDWRAFMDSQWVDTSEPVGSLLTTGGAPRFHDHDWSYAAGFRRDTPGGGRFELSQEIGFRNNNSIYLVPHDQGSGRLLASFSRPLLRGAGGWYNRRFIVLAQLDAGTAEGEFLRQAQAHLIDVCDAYWQLYLMRAMLLQKRRLYQQGQRLHARLESRREVDALAAQILQAKAAVAKRRAGIVRAETAVRNVESRIRALVNHPLLGATPNLELVPHESPATAYVQVGMKGSLTTALLGRPEIEQAVNKIAAGQVELGASRNELLPALDLVLETYVSGLDGRTDVGQALGDQFTEGEPSYTVGMKMDLPLSNRAARARYRQRRLELQKAMLELATAAETIWAEVEVAVREVQTSHREMAAAYAAMAARGAEVEGLQARWETLAGDGQVGSMLLEQLLENQEELAVAEFALARAQVGYNLALTRLKQVDGTLLTIEKDTAAYTDCRGTPPLTVRSRPHAPPIRFDGPQARRPIRSHAAAARIVRLPPVAR